MHDPCAVHIPIEIKQQEQYTLDGKGNKYIIPNSRERLLAWEEQQEYVSHNLRLSSRRPKDRE